MECAHHKNVTKKEKFNLEEINATDAKNAQRVTNSSPVVILANLLHHQLLNVIVTRHSTLGPIHVIHVEWEEFSWVVNANSDLFQDALAMEMLNQSPHKLRDQFVLATSNTMLSPTNVMNAQPTKFPETMHSIKIIYAILLDKIVP